MKEAIDLFRNQKYKRIIRTSFVFTLLFTAFTVYELISSYQLELKRAQVQSNNLNQVLEEQLSGVFKKIDLTLQEVVRTIQNKQYTEHMNADEVKALLTERFKDVPEAKTFFVVDRSGYDVFRIKDGKKLYLGDREYFNNQKNATKDELIFSKPLISRMTGVQTISLSRRIVNSQNEFVGIVAVMIPLTYFRDLYAKLDIGKEGAITLTSNENIMYSRYPWDEKFVGRKLANEKMIKDIFVENKAVVYDIKKSTLDGSVRYNSARRVDNSKFYVIVGISKDEVLAGWKQRSLFFGIGFILLWVVGAIYLINFLKSLQELEKRRKIAIQSAQLTSLGEMASGIAHEINNPLTIISTRANQLKKQIERGQYDPEDFKASLVKINQTVDRIAKVIRGLKTFSRNADQDSLNPVALRKIIENALDLCSEKFRYEMVMLKIDPIPEFIIECREVQLVQVLFNILNNAYDAVEPLEDKWVHLSFALGASNTISIIVTDSGKGIPDNIAQNIMHPFFTTKEVGKGAGLGLSISKGIVESHKGNFYLQRKAKNTSFVIELPLNNALNSNEEMMKAS